MNIDIGCTSNVHEWEKSIEVEDNTRDLFQVPKLLAKITY